MPLLVVFGYGPGVSHATAARYAAEGYSVALVGRTAERLATGVQQLAAAGAEVRSYRADAADPDAIRSALTAIRSDLGPASVILWTAFRNGAVSDVLAAEPVELLEVFRVGVVGLLAAVQAAYQDLVAAEDAAVLVVNGALGEPSSELDHVSAVLGGDGTAMENAAKSKLVGLLAERLRRDGIYVGQVTIFGTIAGTATASPTAIEPAAVADLLRTMSQERTETRARIVEERFSLE